MDDIGTRLKRAELLATIGAGALGAGFALLIQRWREVLAAMLLVVGLIVHGWGIYAKRRLENESRLPRTPWVDTVYWLCWAALGGLIAYIVVRYL